MNGDITLEYPGLKLNLEADPDNEAVLTLVGDHDIIDRLFAIIHMDIMEGLSVGSDNDD